jgi:carbamoyl-phosphate synthase large subunit
MAIAAIQMLNQIEDIKTVALDANPLAAGLYLANKGYIVPPFNDSKFFLKLQSIIEKENIDVILPALDTILLEFARNKKRLEKIGTKVIISNEESIIITRDKWKTYKALYAKIPLPKSYIRLKDITIDFPLFIKPRDGSGSINIYKINDREDLNFFFKKVKNPIIQEYLHGKEYTVDCLTDINGKLLISIKRERIETKAGISVKGKIIQNQKLDNMAHKIAENIFFQGPFFFQAKEDDNGEPKLTEINARISGTMSLSSASGVNIHNLAVRLFMGENVQIPKIKTNLYITRYWNDIFVTKKDFEKKLYS